MTAASLAADVTPASLDLDISGMTCAACAGRVERALRAVPGVTDAWVEVVWEPMWTKDRMSEAAKLTLGFF